MAKDDIDFGRYSEPALLILVSLASEPKHGYAIMDDTETLTDTRLGPGTLYGALNRLEQHGYIEALTSEDRRRPYRSTAQGIAFLREELHSLEKFVKVGLQRLEAQ
jgi:DNA-binding PadR family transcriptional regulator